MFAAGIGQMDAVHRRKGEPKKGMLVVKLGGPAYRIGIGGGAASSLAQGDNKASLDFNAVQRCAPFYETIVVCVCVTVVYVQCSGDAEMEQKVNRVIRTCIELGPANPIISIHDQGAGGNANVRFHLSQSYLISFLFSLMWCMQVLKEIGEPAGARIEVRKILLGDESLSVLEIWGAEYQEADALVYCFFFFFFGLSVVSVSETLGPQLIDPNHEKLFGDICCRERAPYATVGVVRLFLHPWGSQCFSCI